MITLGVDEVGRGCWAGPVVAGAVILSKPLAGLKDSKVLPVKERVRLKGLIESSAVVFALGWVSAQEVDALGLTAAVRLAMQRAVEHVKVPYDEIIVDGNYNYLVDDPRSTALIRADAIVPAVSAASILAKVARDEFMVTAAKNYPNYGFEKHVGYGTKFHHEQLLRYGVSEMHRKSYRPIKNLLLELPA